MIDELFFVITQINTFYIFFLLFLRSQNKHQNQFTMKKIAFLMMAFVSVIFFTGCPGHDPEYINLGTIPEKYLPTVPYEDGQTFYLQHESDRVVIPFKVTRHRVQAQGNNGFDDNLYLEKYKPSPTVFFDYEEDITSCKPDYPLFNIDFRFSNAYLADSLYYQNYDPMSPKNALLGCLDLYASIPFIGESTDQCVVLDSIEVNGRTYKEVFEFGNQNQYPQVQTLYYNYVYGVIAILMSNGEKYLRYEEE